MEKNDYLKRYIDDKSNYCYEGTDILINKRDIKDADTLERVERIHTTYILSKLYLSPVKGRFDIEHYINIHKVLFQDLYSFAGEIRRENISKGGIPFCRPEFIYKYLKYLLEQMNEQSYKLKNEEELIEFLAFFYSEINVVHPFREGNGRSQREFFREFVLELNKRVDFGNYEIDFSVLKESDKKILISGCIEGATKGTTELLKKFFKACLIKNQQKHL